MYPVNRWGRQDYCWTMEVDTGCGLSIYDGRLWIDDIQSLVAFHSLHTLFANIYLDSDHTFMRESEWHTTSGCLWLVPPAAIVYLLFSFILQQNRHIPCNAIWYESPEREPICRPYKWLVISWMVTMTSDEENRQSPTPECPGRLLAVGVWARSSLITSPCVEIFFYRIQ